MGNSTPETSTTIISSKDIKISLSSFSGQSQGHNLIFVSKFEWIWSKIGFFNTFFETKDEFKIPFGFPSNWTIRVYYLN